MFKAALSRLPVPMPGHVVIALVLACVAAPRSSPAQDDAVQLAALRSRDAMVRAMNEAARQLGASGDGSVSRDTWRSALMQRQTTAFINNRSVYVSYSVTVTGSMSGTGQPNDSLRVVFRAQVAADAQVSSTDRSVVARQYIIQVAMRTNQALGRDPVH